jgi:hypothetical protein
MVLGVQRRHLPSETVPSSPRVAMVKRAWVPPISTDTISMSASSKASSRVGTDLQLRCDGDIFLSHRSIKRFPVKAV